MPDGLFGSCLFAECEFGQRIIDPYLCNYEVTEYMLQVRTADDVLLAYLPFWKNGTWTQERNKPDLIQFSYPAHDDACAYFVKPNIVALVDYTAYTDINRPPMQKFRVQYTEGVGISGNEYITVHGESLLGQLAEEFVTEYDVTARAALWYVIGDLLAFQAKPNTQQIYRSGHWFSADVGPPYNVWVTNKSILRAIEELQQRIGGWYWVNSSRRFLWHQYYPPRGSYLAGAPNFIRFERGKNLRGINVHRDYRNIVTRLYAYGYGSSRDSRLNLIDAGEANEYIRDAAAEAAYGVVSRVYENSSIKDAAELLAEAQYFLGLYKEPEISYSVNVVALAEDRNHARDFEAVDLGSRVHVIDDVLGISTNQVVTRLVRNLDLPFNIQVNLDSISRTQGGRKSITDVIKRLADRVDDFALSDDTQLPLSDTVPVGPSDTAAAGTSGEASRQDHVHPSLSNANPVGLGAAAPGAGTAASRHDHKHPYEVYT